MGNDDSISYERQRTKTLTGGVPEQQRLEVFSDNGPPKSRQYDFTREEAQEMLEQAVVEQDQIRRSLGGVALSADDLDTLHRARMMRIKE